MSADRRSPVVEYHGQSPCVPPHILGRLLDKLQPLKARLRAERQERDGWAVIDAAARQMEATR